MDAPWEGPREREDTASQLLARALAEFASPGPHAPKGDLLEELDELERNVLLRHWEGGHPRGDGGDYFDELMQIRMKRLEDKARNQTRGENIWLAGKAGAVVLLLAVAWQYFV